MSLMARRAAMTTGDSVMPRFGGTALRATKKGPPGTARQRDGRGQRGHVEYRDAGRDKDQCRRSHHCGHFLIGQSGPVDEDPFDHGIASGDLQHLPEIAGGTVDEQWRAPVTSPVPDGERPLLIGIDQKAGGVLAVGERCEVHRKGTLPYPSLLGGNSDDMHALKPAALLPP